MPTAHLGPYLDIPRAQHRAFLVRAADARAHHDATATALGAFLVMRVIDQTHHARAAEVFHEQLAATAEFVCGLPPTREREHLSAVLDAADANGTSAHPGVHIALGKYADWLEGQMRVTEALDVTDTALQLDGVDESEGVVAVVLRRARLLRAQARFTEACHLYDLADQLAATCGDEHGGRLSRIGRALVLQKTGNLPASEALLRDVVATARDAGDHDAEARACHDLAGTLHYMGRGTEAVPWAYRAWCLYTDPVSRLRALSDAGQTLKELGHLEAAVRALETVVDHDPPPDVRTRAKLELFELRAMRDDHLNFERTRRALEREAPELPIEERLDLALKTGVGCAMFGRFDEALTALEASVAMAEAHGLGERLIAAEAMLQAVAQCQLEGQPLVRDSGSRESTPDLEETIANLKALVPAQ